MQTTKYPLINQNSCGQGEFVGVENHPLSKIAQSFGYKYSHSTNTGVGDNKWRLWHTFRHITKPEHTFSFYEDSMTVETSCSSSSNYCWRVSGIDNLGNLKIFAHLKNKQRRYKLYL